MHRLRCLRSHALPSCPSQCQRNVMRHGRVLGDSIPRATLATTRTPRCDGHSHRLAEQRQSQQGLPVDERPQSLQCELRRVHAAVVGRLCLRPHMPTTARRQTPQGAMETMASHSYATSLLSAAVAASMMPKHGPTSPPASTVARKNATHTEEWRISSNAMHPRTQV